MGPIIALLFSVFCYVDSDVIISRTEFTLSLAVTEVCMNIQTLNDSLIEEAEAFRIEISVEDRGAVARDDATVTILDSNVGEVMVEFDQPSYTGEEGEMVVIRVLVTSDPANIQRDVMLTVITREGTAEG